MIKSTYFKKDYSDILFHNFQSVYCILFFLYIVCSHICHAPLLLIFLGCV